VSGLAHSVRSAYSGWRQRVALRYSTERSSAATNRSPERLVAEDAQVKECEVVEVLVSSIGTKVCRKHSSNAPLRLPAHSAACSLLHVLAQQRGMRA
jgi:hypothetical protein